MVKFVGGKGGGHRGRVAKVIEMLLVNVCVGGGGHRGWVAKVIEKLLVNVEGRGV